MHGYGKSRFITQIEHASMWESVASVTGTTDDYCPD